MSHFTYDEIWLNTQNYLSATIQSEPTQADRRQHRKLLATLYYRYIQASNNLAEVVDQITQPQKRMLARKLLEATLGRILELKNDLVEADLTEYSHCGDVLEDLNLTTLQAELKTPTCFRNERKDELNWQKTTMDNVLSKLGFLDEEGEKKIKLTEAQSILIIQTHERARQGRLRAQFMKEIKGIKDKKPQTGEEEDEEAKLKISLAASLRIQKVWRGYIARRATKRRKLQEMLLIGMIPSPKTKSAIAELEREAYVKQQRRDLQELRQKQYENAIKEIRDHLETNQRGPVLEQLSDQVRNWMNEYRAQTGKIPEYSGGSERTSSRMNMSRQGTDSEMSKSTLGSSKDSKSRKSKSPKDKETKTVEEEDTAVSKATVSIFLPELTVRKEEYDETWKNRDESCNPHQYHYSEIIHQEQMTEMENELRKIVDDMMRAELALLQEAYDRDRGFKGKKQKKASKKTRKGGKKSKKKKEKDLTPDRTIESLFEELVANGIIKKYPEGVLMDDFKGDRSYNPPAPYNRGDEPKIALGDLRQILTEYCIIPLLSNQIHQQTFHIKSLFLAGYKGSGKDMLVHAICNEAGAVLFDLTPANIVGKYPGKSGLTMLIHLVLKVSRLLQPAVIYMDNAERPFVKKIPKTDKTDPKRLKKDLPKIVKNFSPEDRVMLIGVSNCPWDADQKLLQQVYQKFLYIPRPDYSTRYTAWSYLLSKYSAISWQFDTSAISKISDGFTIGSIVSAVQEVMTIKRMLQLRVQPLSPLELVNALSKRTPVYREEEEAMESWWSKTPMVKRRTRAVEILQQELFEQQAKEANMKK